MRVDSFDVETVLVLIKTWILLARKDKNEDFINDLLIFQALIVNLWSENQKVRELESKLESINSFMGVH